MNKHSTDLKQVSALLKQVITKLDDAKIIADYGAGTGDKSSQLAHEFDKKLYRYDPYLPEETNQEFWKAVEGGEVDIVTSSNVLNVIMDDSELHATMMEIIRASKRTKLGAVISVYQAPIASHTQRGKPLKWYAHLFELSTTRTVEMKQGKIWISPEQ